MRSAFLVLVATATLSCSTRPGPAARPPGVRRAVERLPLRFEPNVGQFDANVRFVARRGRSTLFLTDEGATLAVRTSGDKASVIQLHVAKARLVRPRGEAKLVARSSYFLGNDPSRFYTDVPTYARVTYPGVREGVDLVFHGEAGQLEYDFVVAPGVDERGLVLEVTGGDTLAVNARGDLCIHTESGDILQPRPRVFQRSDDNKETLVEASYRLLGEHRVAFVLGPHDRARAVVIDPVLSYATYYGGSASEIGSAIAVDAAGNIFFAGATRSTNFPTTNPLQALNSGGIYDAYVVKLDPAGSAVLFATYIGGTGTDSGAKLALDSAGNAILAGFTNSSDFPTHNPLQATNAGGYDGFLLKLGAAGNTLTFSTYFGGTANEFIQGLAIDNNDQLYLVGQTASTDFPTKNPIQAALSGAIDAVVVKVSAAGDALVYSTYLGGTQNESSSGIAVDSAGAVVVSGYTLSTNFPTKNPLQAANSGGSDGFVAKVDSTGAALVYSTYLGGTGDDYANGVAMDAAGNAYIAGATGSTDFPLVNAFQPTSGSMSDAFVSKLNQAGSGLVYSTYLGGAQYDSANAIAVDRNGAAHVTGYTVSTDFPTHNPLQATFSGTSGNDGFVAKLAPSGTALLYSTYWGGATGADVFNAIALDKKGSVFVTAYTNSTDATTKNPLQAANAGVNDTFVLEITTPAPMLAPASAILGPLSAQAFTASGGTGSGFVYSIHTNASGGAIDATTGAYVAGPTPNVTDEVWVVDSEGGIGSALVTVLGGPLYDGGVLPDGGSASGDGGWVGGDGGIAGSDMARNSTESGCSCDVSRGVSNAPWVELTIITLGLALARRRLRSG